jgi:hypothetical protein
MQHVSRYEPGGGNHRGATLEPMIRWLARFIAYRVFGSRVLMLMAIVNFLRRRSRGRKAPPGVYQPSQGASQIAQRDPRYRVQPRSGFDS